MFLAEFSKYCDKRQREVGTRITQVTCNKYHRLLRYLTEYTRQRYRKDDLPLNMVPSVISRVSLLPYPAQNITKYTRWLN